MLHSLHTLMYIVICAPLLGALLAGLCGRKLGVRGAHSVTVVGMSIAVLAAIGLALQILPNAVHDSFNGYTWVLSGRYQFHIGFLLDSLTAVMILTVSAVSLLVHIYSIGYMQGDAGYQRFFSYMSLFTFFMLMLASANNFLQLFFGWEGVGLVSYLLIGFWFKRESAAAGGLKAFIVNRIGDFGLILGIALIFDHVGSLDYAQVFAALPGLAQQTITLLPGHWWSLMSVICILLFIGAMGKSAQLPLHIWLPESMEGPTPISALIHAATMVTAGVFMVARLSPLFQLSHTALSMVMIVGASGALFLGLLAVVEYDIKRVIAYSTMSQLGYMMVANGASAYHAAIFHLMTHACFKALLFLSAGSVIVALHHEQDLRKMGGLAKYLPWTYVTFLVGALALAAIPPFAGFYSKDAIIEAVSASHLVGAHYAYDCLLLGAFVTAWYTFRAFFMAFHGSERFDDQLRASLHETPWSMRLPLILLAIPSVVLGAWLAGPMLYNHPSLLAMATASAPSHTPAAMAVVPAAAYSPWLSIMHAPAQAAFWFSVAGVIYAYVMYLLYPTLLRRLAVYLTWVAKLLRKQYGFDYLNDEVIVPGVKRMSEFFYRTTDLKWIDHGLVNGLGRGITCLSRLVRRFQSGYLYQYVLLMLGGVLIFIAWVIFGG